MLKRLCTAAVIVAAAALASGCEIVRDLFGPKPNLVFIVIDTLRADHLGVYGYARPTSRNIDRFAAQATVFERMYSPSPWTMPATASMFTSLPPRDHGIAEWKHPLEGRLLTLAEVLNEEGYDTEAVVSHVIFRPKYGFNQGFDRFDTSVLKLGESKSIASSKEVTDLAIEAVDRLDAGPFFLWVHYFDPHNDYLRHEEFDFGRRAVDRYDSEIAYTDRHLGRLLDHLKAAGRFDDSVIAIVADHGEEFGDHGGTRHSKTLYEEVLRVPFILHAPGFAPGRVDTVLWHVDVAPTFLALLEIDAPESFQGRPIESAGDRFVKGKDRTIFAETLRFADKRGVLDQDWKYIHDREAQAVELFDLKADPREKRDLYKASLGRAAGMQQMLDAHNARERAKVSENEIPDDLADELKSLGYLQ
ncbi:sulfatase-like hydrolase/transferase [bacterium]|nr:sulfatase-like hydrolase/transferase [bacterium]